jgi:hypothetical protein
MMDRGEIAQLYDNWLMKSISPASTAVNRPTSEATETAWTSPTDKLVENHARR